MKSSKKGTKLNDVRNFRQSRPYTRKRITKVQLIPDIPGIHGIATSSAKEQFLLSAYPRNSTRSRSRCVTLDCDQRSREIAWISYTSDTEDSKEFCPAEDHFENHGRDAIVEIDPKKEIHISPLKRAYLPARIAENVKHESKVETDKEVQVKLKLQVAEKNIGVESLTEELTSAVPVKLKAQEEFQEKRARECHEETPQVHSDKNNSDSERSFWLRYGSIRKIIDFIGNFFGRHPTESDDKEVTRTVECRQLVEKNIADPLNETTRSNADHLSQEKRCPKRKNVPTKKNTAVKQPENREFPGLTRQIMNTRDKKLRATLVEHEIKARRLEEENRHYRRILEQKLKTRQMSSPLH